MSANDNKAHATKSRTAELIAAARVDGPYDAKPGDYLAVRTEISEDTWELWRSAVVSDGLITFAFDAQGRERRAFDVCRDRFVVPHDARIADKVEAILYQPFAGLEALRRALQQAMLSGPVVSLLAVGGRPSAPTAAPANAVVERVAIAICRASGRPWSKARRTQREQYRLVARAALAATKPPEPDFDEDIAVAVSNAIEAGGDAVIISAHVSTWIDEVLK